MMLRPKSENVSPPVVSDSLQHYGLQPTRSSVHGILQARILAWVAILSSRGSSRPRDRTRASCIRQLLHHMSHKGSRTTSSEHPWLVTGSLLRRATCMPGDRQCMRALAWLLQRKARACVLQAGPLQNCLRWWKSERYHSVHHLVTETQRNTEG